jgi:hypothetical protein
VHVLIGRATFFGCDSTSTAEFPAGKTEKSTRWSMLSVVTVGCGDWVFHDLVTVNNKMSKHENIRFSKICLNRFIATKIRLFGVIGGLPGETRQKPECIFTAKPPGTSRFTRPIFPYVFKLEFWLSHFGPNGKGATEMGTFYSIALCG